MVWTSAFAPVRNSRVHKPTAISTVPKTQVDGAYAATASATPSSTSWVVSVRTRGRDRRRAERTAPASAPAAVSELNRL